MDMKQTAAAVLEMDAEALSACLTERQGKTVGGMICGVLAEAGMKGDIKAVSLLMEIAGEDYRGRESERKNGAGDRQVVLVEQRPG